MTRNAVILGGGISGLSAAYYLQRHAKNFAKIILLEGSNRLGGWINSTIHNDGVIFEHGPRTLRPAGVSGMNSLALVEEIGLKDDVIFPTVASHTGKRYIYVNNKIHLLPSGISTLFKKCPPFTKPLISSVFQELTAQRSDLPDESIHSFFERRLGTEVADYIANPMCRGIFAGDSKQLSIKACFRDLYALEQKHGSLIRGSIRRKTKEEKELVQNMKKSKHPLWSLKYGLQQISTKIEDILQANDNVQICMETPCQQIEYVDGKYLVKTADDVIKADVIFSSVYAKTLSKLLMPNHATLSDLLSRIPAITVAVVNIEFEGFVNISPGFGHLLPSFESKPVLGIIYDSCGFMEHDNKDGPSSRFTVMLGGAWFDEIEDTSVSGLEHLALDSIRTQLGIKEDVKRIQVSVNKDCIPQYLVGHTGLVEEIESKIKEEKLPLHLVGSSYKGPSVNDCIYNAKRAVDAIE